MYYERVICRQCSDSGRTTTRHRQDKLDNVASAGARGCRHRLPGRLHHHPTAEDCSRAVRRAGEVIPAHRTLRVAASGNGADRHRLDRAAGDGRPLCGGVSSVPGALEERGENAVGRHRGSCACRALQSAAVVRKKGGLGDGLVHWTFGRYN